jgi:AraC-like DNA-binding protein
VQVPAERLLAAAADCDVELVRSPRALVVEPGVDRLRRFQAALDRSTEILDQGDLAAWEQIEGDLLLTLVALFDRSSHPTVRADGNDGASAAIAMAARRRLQVALEELDAPAVAADLGISRRHLDRCFKAHYGVSVLEFARFRRLHRAREVLLDRAARVSVTEAAYSCGFKHLGRFARQYRDLFGENPRETVRPMTREARGQTLQRERSDSPSR